MQYIDRDGNRHNIPLYSVQPKISPDTDNALHESPNGLKVDKTVVVLTQAEYDALPESEKQNGNITYLVEDPNASGDTLLIEVLAKNMLDALYPIGSYAFGVKPTIGTWEEVGIKGKYLHNIALRDNDTIMQFLTIINGDSSILNSLNKVCQALYNNGYRSVTAALQSSGHNGAALTYSGAYSPNGTQLYCYKIATKAWATTGWAEYNDTVTELVSYKAYKRTA